MKLCKDCKYYKPPWPLKTGRVLNAECLHKSNASVVDGRPLHSPYNMRYNGVACGINGVLWELR